jgi:hypothetical protein
MVSEERRIAGSIRVVFREYLMRVGLVAELDE